MLKKILQCIVIIFVMNLLFNGCATVLRGYEDEVELINAPKNITVHSKDGVEYPVFINNVKVYSEQTKKFENAEVRHIKLRRNKEHTLLLKNNDKVKLVEVYPKIVGTWLILDFITGVFPMFIDAYTGNWNSFQPINVDFDGI